ncbi:MAG TPA: FlgD immunoglobulin-like domain containing protein [Candidatus Krumholzibacteria bacterium]|nr:FlgD immunoglobulin-like domain containing protein [Candidatus Krumholzibacteria bacterium]
MVTPRDDFTHVDRAAVAYHGLWFDLDDDPATGIDGKEHQEHWYLPNDNPTPIAITRFEARALDPHRVKVEWEASSSDGIESFDLLRATSGDALRRVVPGTFGPATSVFVDETVTPGGHYEYVVVARDVRGAEFISPRIGVTVPSVVLSLGQNSPNPFNESTSFGITLPERADVDVSVYDVSGRRVATIASGVRDAGDYDLDWNGTDDAGRRVAAGVYFYRLEAGGRTLTRKLVLTR